MSWEKILQTRRRVGYTNAKPAEGKPAPWHHLCKRCGQERPRHEFRRWRGNKSITFTTCNTCHPEKTVREMSEAALTAWMNSQKVPNNVRNKVWADRRARISQTHHEIGGDASRTYWAGVRRETWSDALMRIRHERDLWRAIASRPTPRQPFAARYLEVLVDLLDVITRTIKHGVLPVADEDLPKRHSTRMVLGGVEKDGKLCYVEVDDPADWPLLLGSATLRELAALHEDCVRALREQRQGSSKGRRTSDPVFLRALAC